MKFLLFLSITIIVVISIISICHFLKMPFNFLTGNIFGALFTYFGMVMGSKAAE